jgi:hypothetical protein
VNANSSQPHQCCLLITALGAGWTSIFRSGHNAAEQQEHTAGHGQCVSQHQARWLAAARESTRGPFAGVWAPAGRAAARKGLRTLALMALLLQAASASVAPALTTDGLIFGTGEPGAWDEAAVGSPVVRVRPSWGSGMQPVAPGAQLDAGAA